MQGVGGVTAHHLPAMYTSWVIDGRAWPRMSAIRGANVGAALIDWAARRAQSDGRKWIRLDAWRSNRGLWQYYLDRGFDLVRVVDDPSGSGACFQRDATVQLGRGPEVREE